MITVDDFLKLDGIISGETTPTEIFDGTELYDILESKFNINLTQEDINSLELVIQNLNLKCFNNFEVSTSIFLLHGRYLAVSGVSKTYSDHVGIVDCGINLSFEEYEAYETVSYRPKK